MEFCRYRREMKLFITVLGKGCNPGLLVKWDYGHKKIRPAPVAAMAATATTYQALDIGAGGALLRAAPYHGSAGAQGC